MDSTTLHMFAVVLELPANVPTIRILDIARKTTRMKRGEALGVSDASRALRSRARRRRAGAFPARAINSAQGSGGFAPALLKFAP
jgi:hypothetical protein